MKPVYAVRCTFQGDPEQSAATAWELTTAWLGGEAPVEAPALGGASSTGRHEREDGSTISWRTLHSTEGTVGRLVHDIPPREDQLGWRTMAWICNDGTGAYAIIRSGPQNPAGIITTVRFDSRRPRVISSWLRELEVVADGQRLGEKALNYGLNDIDALVALLHRPDRRLPVVAVSKAIVDGAQRSLLDLDRLPYRLAANAHVVAVDRACSRAITEAVGKSFSVFEGAARVWWPQLTVDDDPYRHPLILAEQVREDAHRAEERIVRSVWRAAVDALAPPALEFAVLTAHQRAETERRMAKLAHRADEAKEWEELLDQQFAENAELRERVEDLQADLDDTRMALAHTLAQSAPTDDEDDDLPDVASVEDAVRLASERAAHTTYLKGAFAAARESKYPDPRQVLRDLLSVERVAARWAAGDLPGGFKSGFATEPVTYCERISQTASTKYASDYEIDYAGATAMMGPHLRRGIGPPEAILRIYWYVDDISKQFVVGHVGRKLRDKTNN